MNIQAHDSVFLSDMEKYQFDSVRRMTNLLREFDKAGIETALFEEYRSTPASRQAEPMSREYLKNMLQRDRTITRQVLEEIERETAAISVQRPGQVLFRKYRICRMGMRKTRQVPENR